MYIAIQCAKQFTDMLPGPKANFCGCYMHYSYVTFSHIRSKAQTVVHNLCITLVVNQNSPSHFTGIHYQQQHNKPSTTLEWN